MKRMSKICIFGVALMLIVSAGCVDGVRQAAAGPVFDGLQTMADGLISGEENSTAMTDGAKSIVQGLLDGLKVAVYPKG